MKRFILVLIALAAFAAYGDEYSKSLTDGVMESFGLFKEVSTANAYCTLTTSNTKTILSSTKIPNEGYIFVLAHDTITGTSAASGIVEIVVQCLDNNNKVLKDVLVDSIVGSTEQYGGLHEIPFFSEAVGHKFKIILRGDTGAQNIFNRLYIYQLRPIVYNGKWR
jgi:hypothetical protein